MAPRTHPALTSLLVVCFLAACVYQSLPTAVGSDGVSLCHLPTGVSMANGSKWTPREVPSEWVGRINNSFCLLCSCVNSEVDCEDITSRCPPVNCPPERHRVFSCCTLCAPPDSDTSSGSGWEPPPVEEVHSGCLDEQSNLRQHGSCWNITYQGQAMCVGVCCDDGHTSIVQPTCPLVPPCKRGEQPYSGPLQCCRQCLPGGMGGPHSPPPPVVSLKECEGKRPYRVYLADPKAMDAFAYYHVNEGRVHVIQWNSTGPYSLEVSRTTFAVHPQWAIFLYQGRSTAASVSEVGGNPTKKWRVGECSLQCAQVAVAMLGPSMKPVQLEEC